MSDDGKSPYSKFMDDNGLIRGFESGAIRDTEHGKPDYEGYMHPLVVKAFGAYMLKHQHLTDGSSRTSDNWQGKNGKGFPRDVLMKSAWRHFLDLWLEHRGYQSREGIEDALCGLIFNANAYLLEVIRERDTTATQNATPCRDKGAVK